MAVPEIGDYVRVLMDDGTRINGTVILVSNVYADIETVLHDIIYRQPFSNIKILKPADIKPADINLPINGPIVACANAIEHYMREITNAKGELAKAERMVVQHKQNLNEYQKMLDIWQDAKLTLQQAAANTPKQPNE